MQKCWESGQNRIKVPWKNGQKKKKSPFLLHISKKSCTFAQNFVVFTTVERRSNDGRSQRTNDVKPGISPKNNQNLMSQVVPAASIDEIHGKLYGRSDGYFYQSKKTGKIFYRERVEDYQKNQSPRQKWNSAAFKAANSQLKLILNNPDSKAQMEADYEVAKHIASNGKMYSTIRAWKFNSLLHEYKLSHPFVQP